MTDAFERLKNRARPAVPPRDASLVKHQNDEMTEFSHPVKSENQTDGVVTHDQSEISELASVVRRTVRLSEDIDDGLEQLCSKEKITREVFLEAAYVLCMENQQFITEVLKVAQIRYKARKVAGERRKFRTMEKKLRTP